MVKRLGGAFICALLALNVIVSASGQGHRGQRLTLARNPDTTLYCTRVASPTSYSDPATLTTHSLTVTAATGCTWTAVSNDTSFITVTSGASGNGNGSVGIMVAANSGSARSGTLTIAGYTITVTQSGTATNCSGATSAQVVCNGFGYGMSTRAAYGMAPTVQPRIYRVDTTADDNHDNTQGDGTHKASLRVAVEGQNCNLDGAGNCPRVVVFETSGTFGLTYQEFAYDNKVDIQVFKPYLTVAGQTAPSPGIQIRYGGITILSHDILLQHIRIRPGDGGPLLKSTADHDAITIYSYTTGQTPAYDVHDIVLDHLSVSWTGGKLFNIDQRYIANGNVTLWRVLGAEALYRAANVFESVSGSPPADWPGSGQPSSLAVPWVDHTTHVSVLQSVFAHSSGRHPEVHAGATGVWANNTVYDFGGDQNPYNYGMLLYGVETASDGYPVITYDPYYVYFRGNKYIGGPSAAQSPMYVMNAYAGAAGSQVYDTDNITDTVPGLSLLTYTQHMSFDPRVGTPPSQTPVTGFSFMTAAVAAPFVLTNAGARPLDRDSVDTRIISEVNNKTGHMITSQTAVGGWPTFATNIQTFTVPASPNTVTASGYTNLEVALHNAAALVEP